MARSGYHKYDVVPHHDALIIERSCSKLREENFLTTEWTNREGLAQYEAYARLGPIPNGFEENFQHALGIS